MAGSQCPGMEDVTGFIGPKMVMSCRCGESAFRDLQAALRWRSPGLSPLKELPQVDEDGAATRPSDSGTRVWRMQSAL